jgi:hypothetical protein
MEGSTRIEHDQRNENDFDQMSELKENLWLNGTVKSQ